MIQDKIVQNVIHNQSMQATDHEMCVLGQQFLKTDNTQGKEEGKTNKITFEAVLEGP